MSTVLLNHNFTLQLHCRCKCRLVKFHSFILLLHCMYKCILANYYNHQGKTRNTDTMGHVSDTVAKILTKFYQISKTNLKSGYILQFQKILVSFFLVAPVSNILQAHQVTLG